MATATKRTALMVVTAALAKVREVKSRQPGQVPKIDAIEAILNADLIDRRSGLTVTNEETVGLNLARRVKVAA